MGAKDENQTPPRRPLLPSFFSSTRIGPATVATAGTKRRAAPNQNRSANGVRSFGVRRNAVAPLALYRLVFRERQSGFSTRLKNSITRICRRSWTTGSLEPARCVPSMGRNSYGLPAMKSASASWSVCWA